MYNYCIVGGGVLGSAVGKILLEQQPEASVIIIEQFAGLGQGNTTRSNAAYRNIFDTTVNIQLASSSIAYYKTVEAEGGDLGRQEIGYLFLLTQQQYDSYSTPSIEVDDQKLNFFQFLSRQNIDFDLYEPQELQQKFPHLALDPHSEVAKIIQAPAIVKGFLGRQCGHFSPDLIVQHYGARFRQLGGEVRLNTTVKRICLGSAEEEFDPDYIPKTWEKPVVKAVEVETAEGQREYIKAENYIITTGAWINELLDPLGARSMVKAKKRQLFTLDGVKEFIHQSEFTAEAVFPFTILPTGVFLKPLDKAGSLVIGVSDVIGRRFEPSYRLPDSTASLPEMDDPQAEEDFYIINILPVLQSYFPTVFDTSGRVKGSAGNYAYSIDKYPVVDRVEPLPNLYFSSGASGSGIMKADSIARLCVAMLRGQEMVELYDGTSLAVSRFTIKYRDLPDETLVL